MSETRSEIVDKLVCPNCKNEEFLAGPRGGSAQNVMCTKCGCKLNICPLPDGRIWVIEIL